MVDLLHAMFKLILPQRYILVLLSHKRVANVWKHYELRCIPSPKTNIFFLEKMFNFMTTAIDRRNEKLEVVLSLKLVVPGRAQIPKATEFSFSPFVKNEGNGHDLRT